jgi:hypothetical protein
MLKKVKNWLFVDNMSIVWGWLLAVHGFELIMLPSLLITTEVLSKYSLSQRFVQIWISTLDIPHYINIAKYGYGIESFAFFPAWPIILKLVNANALLSKIISVSFTVIFFVLFLKLIKQWKYNQNIKEIIISYIAYPFSFLLLTPLTEPFYLIISAGIFLLVENKKYFYAALLAGIASATRWTGILFLVYLLMEIWIKGGIGKLLKYWWTLLVCPLGLVIYSIYLQVYYGNFLLFYKQSNVLWGRSVGLESVTKIIGEFSVFFSQLTGTFKPVPINILQFGSVFIFILLLLIAFRKINHSLWIFCLLNFLVPLMSGSTMGFPRYILVVFPLFLPLGKFFYKHTTIYYGYLALGFMLQAYLLIRFFQFEWIA